MALQGQSTTADYLQWNEYQILLLKLRRDHHYRLAAIVSLGVNTLLRYSDFSEIKWADILDNDMLVIQEKKTGKQRKIKLNSELKSIIREACEKEDIQDYQTPIVNSSVQYLNRTLKSLKAKYALSLENFSTHSFRKTAGRRLAEKHQFSGEILVRLMALFNHSSLTITKRYLGITQKEINDLYEDLAM